MSIDLIINPHARMHRRNPAAAQALRSAAVGCRVHVTRDLDELERVCGQIVEDSRLVLLAGGDGSLMAGVSALVRCSGGKALPPIAPIPMGTAGTVARNWGLHGRPAQCLSRLLDGPRRLVPRASLRVRLHASAGQQEPKEPLRELVGFIFGTGLVARFFEIYNARGAPGYAGAAKLVARIFAESFVGGGLAEQVLTPLPCRLTVQGRDCKPPAWSLICSATVANLGIGMRLIYRAAEDPRRPHLVASALPPRALGPRAPLVLAGKPLGGADHIDRLAEHFSVTFEERGPFVLDGELLSAHRIDVSAGPTLDIATPAHSSGGH